MSRIGRLPVSIPSGVTVNVDENNNVTVSGKLGTLAQKVDKIIKVEVKDNEVVLDTTDEIVSSILVTTKEGKIVHKGAVEAMGL